MRFKQLNIWKKTTNKKLLSFFCSEWWWSWCFLLGITFYCTVEKKTVKWISILHSLYFIILQAKKKEKILLNHISLLKMPLQLHGRESMNVIHIGFYEWRAFEKALKTLNTSSLYTLHKNLSQMETYQQCLKSRTLLTSESCTPKYSYET